MTKIREWLFQVSCKVDQGEQVCLTGSCEELGSWDVQKVIPLEPETTFTAGDPDSEIIWKASLKVPFGKIKYRYCICFPYPKDVDHKPQENDYIIRKWETHLQPRTLPEYGSNTASASVDIFGVSSALEKTDRGWLIKENLFQIILYCSPVYNDPVVLWKSKHKDKKCFVKVTPIEMNENTQLPSGAFGDESTEVELSDLRVRSSVNSPLMEVSKLAEGCEKFQSQSQFGIHLERENCVIFQCRVHQDKSYAFLVDYYIEKTPDDIPHYIGCSYILASNFQRSVGVVSLPITSQKHVPIGQLTAHYALIKPMKDTTCNLEISYARYWKNSWRGIEVGHRGAGNSFHLHAKNCANIRENTIASLIYAAENGADMVEFDVQLSKDLVPVLYHDFYALINLKKRKETQDSDLMSVPIKDLTLEQLQALKIYHRTEKGTSRFNDEDNEDHHPFPTLEKAMKLVPETCGFNLEVKWNNIRVDGSPELNDPFDANTFLDIILKVVFECKTKRRIVFSCFNPNICNMLRIKQNRFPVLFLTDPKGSEDFRSRSLSAAIYFASSIKLLGVNPNSTQILNNTKELDSAFQHKLVVFCWGDQNADRGTVDTLIGLGLHAIIYDKIDVHNTKSKKGNIFLCEEQEESNYCVLFSNSYTPHLNVHQISKRELVSQEENPTNFTGVLSKAICNNIKVSS